MFIDFNDLADDQAWNVDLCIIGAGPAGIAIASKFLATGVSVCLIESGGLEADSAIQALADGEMVGRPEDNLKGQRNRQFGGSTNSWAGACAPMSEIDFEPRPWLGLEGWPFSMRDLEPYYKRAQTMFEIGPFNYEARHWDGGGNRFLAFDPTLLETRIWQLSPQSNFGLIYREAFRSSANCKVLLNATVTEISAHEAMKTIIGIRVESLGGKTATVKARTYVLACGGIDNARLLLLSRQHTLAGLGNEHGLVGRYFMQHPHVGAASLRFTAPLSWTKSYKDFCNGGLWLRARFGLTREAQEHLGILNPVASVINRFITNSLTHSQSIGYLAVKRLTLGLSHGRVPLQLPSELGKIAKDLPGVVTGSWQHLRHRTGALYFMNEQMPNPESRVTLSSKRDAFGLEKARVNWRLSPIDKHSIRVMVHTIGFELKRLGLADVTADDWLTADDTTWPDSLNGGYHHMGTTRMGTTSRASVVDPDAKVHGLDNLYIAGSSIFPTVGCANPTLTLVATSLKLADHLSDRLAERSMHSTSISYGKITPIAPYWPMAKDESRRAC